MKTLPQISKTLNISISTLRYRLDKHSDFIPYLTTGKGKEYSDEGEAIIAEISQYYADNKSPDEINMILASKYAMDLVVEQQPTTIVEQQPLELVRLNNNLERLIEAMNGQQELQRQINDLRSEFRESRVERNKGVLSKIKELLGWQKD